MVLGALLTLSIAGAANAASSELFISEYIEGSGQSKALEIYNGTGGPVDLAAQGYNVFISFNGGTSTRTINLTGTVAAGDVYVYAQATADPAVLAQADQTDTSTSFWNGDDAVQLRKGAAVVDAIGQLGFDPGTEWGAGEVSTADNTLRRKPSIEAGDTDGGNVFDPAVEWTGFAQNTFDGLGSHDVGPPPPNDPVAVSCGSGVTLVQGGTATTSVTATDPDGIVLGFTASTSPSPAPGTIAITSQSPASTDGGTASATISVSNAVAPGTYTVEVTASNDDATPQTAICSFTVTITGITPIGVVQGSVGPAAN